ncbi:hypothetical protein DSO57_1008315 [Entomophthora muscae]|uniref:Uncharacterized protein n=1 Tax=Entomophthora muscae TaxID=34485 RepID=A0ACC2RLV2_9FUNG|nr:hypothetical protein DSO57_1008315 [Entomophthora muscae]
MTGCASIQHSISDLLRLTGKGVPPGYPEKLGEYSGRAAVALVSSSKDGRLARIKLTGQWLGAKLIPLIELRYLIGCCAHYSFLLLLDDKSVSLFDRERLPGVRKLAGDPSRAVAST